VVSAVAAQVVNAVAAQVVSAVAAVQEVVAVDLGQA